MGLAFYNVLGAIGGFVSPYIVGRLSNGGSYNSSMYVQGAFNLAAALMVLGRQSRYLAMPVVGSQRCSTLCTVAVICASRGTRCWRPCHA